MSAVSLAFSDTMTMLRRQLVHARRYPMMLYIAGVPIVFLLLFVYVFGGTLGAGLAGIVAGGRAQYLAYVVPGVLLMAVAMAAQGTAIGVAQDMNEGIVARFKTMDVSRTAVLTAHVLSIVIQTMMGIVVTIGVALLIGYRTGASAAGWAGALGMLTLAAFAVTWPAVGCGLVAKSIESASNLPMPLMLLPFFGSGFVPTASLPVGLRWFAAFQPFTPIIETVRRLLEGTPVGTTWLVAVAWCVAMAFAGYVWSARLYERERLS